MIPEPQLTYVLELLKALGSSAEDFVVAGAQAMKFMLEKARGTKDIDFVLDIMRLRAESPSIAATLATHGYTVVKESQNFQFEKPIPGSKEVMRIEFMAPEEFKREKDFRVDVEKGVHARSCTGGSIALAESSFHPISGKLPDGSPFSASVRVTKPHALVMLKLLALDDRYRNIRGFQYCAVDSITTSSTCCSMSHPASSCNCSGLPPYQRRSNAYSSSISTSATTTASFFLWTSIPAIRYRIGFLLAGAESVPKITLSRVSGYRRSHGGRDNAPLIRSITHAPDQTPTRPCPLQC
jgi:hypothetical protein